MKTKKIFLPESELPRYWYNILPDMPTPMEPPLHPGTGEPVGPDDFAPLLPMALIEQEVSQQSEIPIPEEINPTQPLPRRITIKRPVPNEYIRKPVPANGEVRFLLPAPSLDCPFKYLWSKSAFFRNPCGG
jgi:hypothetical protein